jgi:hypothetical protein
MMERQLAGDIQAFLMVWTCKVFRRTARAIAPSITADIVKRHRAGPIQAAGPLLYTW